MQSVIEVRDLQKIYTLPRRARKNGEQTFEAVRGISFSVSGGEIFGILGPNGAGKTTTLEIIECMKPQSAGTVEVLGYKNLENPQAIKQRIGVQLQTSEYLPSLSLSELLTMFGWLYHQAVKPKELLVVVGLEDKIKDEVKNLSGGQKQRFSIACALVHEPKVLFLDEPTTGLDPRARRDIWDLIRTINKRSTTIVLTTHYMEEAEYLCDRVAIMDHGKILAIDNPRSLINNLAHTTQVSFFTVKPIDQSIFEGLGIEKIYSHYPKVILEIRTLDHIDDIIQRLKDSSIAFTGFTVRTATLEDVYLDLTGQELEIDHT